MIIDRKIMGENRQMQLPDFDYKQNRVDRDSKIKKRKQEIRNFQKDRLKRRKNRLYIYNEVKKELKTYWKKSGWTKRMFILIVVIVIIASMAYLVYKMKKSKSKK